MILHSLWGTGLSHADLVILSGQSGPSFTVGHWVKSCRLGYLVRTKWSFIHCGLSHADLVTLSGQSGPSFTVG